MKVRTLSFLFKARKTQHEHSAYLENFPPPSMNVKIKLVPYKNPQDPETEYKKSILVAAKDFKIGEEIYTVIRA